MNASSLHPSLSLSLPSPWTLSWFQWFSCSTSWPLPKQPFLSQASREPSLFPCGGKWGWVLTSTGHPAALLSPLPSSGLCAASVFNICALKQEFVNSLRFWSPWRQLHLHSWCLAPFVTASGTRCSDFPPHPCGLYVKTWPWESNAQCWLFLGCESKDTDWDQTVTLRGEIYHN